MKNYMKNSKNYLEKNCFWKRNFFLIEKTKNKKNEEKGSVASVCLQFVECRVFFFEK